MTSTRLAHARWLPPLALAALLGPACTSTPRPVPTTPAAPAPGGPGVALTIFAGFPGAPARPPEVPRFAPLDDVFAACPDVRPAAAVTLPLTAGATAALALPDGGRADVRWEDPTTLRILVTGVPRARPGAALTYQLLETSRTVLFWGPTGAPDTAGPCAYVVVGDGAPDR